MVGIAAELELDALLAKEALQDLTHFDLAGLAYNIGALLESSTKERIATGKAAPDGAPWAPWSDDYAKTRAPRHSLLVGGGNPGLLESVQNYTTGTTVTVGTNLVYGAVHQAGSAADSTGNIPARPYLGLSPEDRDDITDLVVGMIQ